MFAQYKWHKSPLMSQSSYLNGDAVKEQKVGSCSQCMILQQEIED